MTDELDLDLEWEEGHINTKTQERIQGLSNKVKTTAEERDAEAKARAEAEERASKAEKESAFYASFSDVTAKYSSAAEYKDAIKEKVMSGYSVEDATVAVLAKEGKFSQPVQQAPAPGVQAIAGGSSVNTPTMGAEKTVGQMSRDELREALLEAERRGDISNR